MLNLRPETVSGKEQPSFIGFRQQSASCEATTRIRFSAKSSHEKAGLLLFQNETHYYFLCMSVDGDKPVMQLFQSSGDSLLKREQMIVRDNDIIELRILIRKNTINFSYRSGQSKKWKNLTTTRDGKFLSTHTAGGFVGTVIGLYGTSSSNPSNNVANFERFTYQDL